MYKKGIDILVGDALSCVTPMDPEDNIQLPIIAVNMITKQILMSVEYPGSFSNKLERVQHKMNSSQDSKVTLVQDFLVTRKTC